MLPNNDELSKKTLKNEKITKKVFENMGYVVNKISENKEYKTPDYEIKADNKTIILCEVKTIFSAGYDKKGNYYISTIDNNIHKSKGFSFDPLPDTIDKLKEAEKQYSEYSDRFRDYKNTPFIVALFPNFLADSFDLIKINESFLNDNQLNNISGIIQLDENRKRTEAKNERISKNLKDLNQANPNDRQHNLAKALVNGSENKNLPPETKEFKLFNNRYAKNKIPEDFRMKCN